MGVLTTSDWTWSFPGRYYPSYYWHEKVLIMVNIENLPKAIIANGDMYILNLHVTFRNKLCVGYHNALSPNECVNKKKEYFIFSCVVEPDMDKNAIPYSDAIDGIVDVPNIEMAWNVLSTRINTALGQGVITIKYL